MFLKCGWLWNPLENVLLEILDPIQKTLQEQSRRVRPCGADYFLDDCGALLPHLPPAPSPSLWERIFLYAACVRACVSDLERVANNQGNGHFFKIQALHFINSG